MFFKCRVMWNISVELNSILGNKATNTDWGVYAAEEKLNWLYPLNKEVELEQEIVDFCMGNFPVLLDQKQCVVYKLEASIQRSIGVSKKICAQG